MHSLDCLKGVWYAARKHALERLTTTGGGVYRSRTQILQWQKRKLLRQKFNWDIFGTQVFRFRAPPPSSLLPHAWRHPSPDCPVSGPKGLAVLHAPGLRPRVHVCKRQSVTAQLHKSCGQLWTWSWPPAYARPHDTPRSDSSFRARLTSRTSIIAAAKASSLRSWNTKAPCTCTSSI